MSTTMFDSKTYGIGELITQRKLFSVPLHQRNYSWGDEQVEQFLFDIQCAFEDKTKDYFIGLMVLQGPADGVWEVLDGQQRLTTVTMIYSAIRNWLKERNFSEDSSQIEAEYLGVRQLGGEFSTRVRLNSINHAFFETHIIRSSPTDELIRERKSIGNKTSNYLLLDAAIHCREWVSKFADKKSGSTESKAKELFGLSRFLETGVKVVSVDVATDADAYVLFESLNNRGADLSALDLVKNYIFSIAPSQEFPQLEIMWERLTQLIEGTDADDFLKYFWTARFGIIQKSDLFKKIRQEFNGNNAAMYLLAELLDAAEFAEALDEVDHPIWLDYSRTVQEGVAGIKVIGSKQARPLLYSAIKKLDQSQLESFLHDLISSLVRYQVIGHGRTGVLEKVLGKVAPLIWHGQIADKNAWESYLRELMTSNEQFVAEFFEHHEQKVSRSHYMLKEIEKLNGANPDDLMQSKLVLLPLNGDRWREEKYKKFGIHFILEKQLHAEFAKAVKNKTYEEAAQIGIALFAKSSFVSTNSIAKSGKWNEALAEQRTFDIANAAAKCWHLN